VVLATADVPGSALERSLAAVGRRLFLRGFLRSTGTRAARAAVPAAVAHRLADPNVTDAEKARMELSGGAGVLDAAVAATGARPRLRVSMVKSRKRRAAPVTYPSPAPVETQGAPGGGGGRRELYHEWHEDDPARDVIELQQPIAR